MSTNMLTDLSTLMSTNMPTGMITNSVVTNISGMISGFIAAIIGTNKVLITNKSTNHTTNLATNIATQLDPGPNSMIVFKDTVQMTTEQTFGPVEPPERLISSTIDNLAQFSFLKDPNTIKWYVFETRVT